MASIWTQPSGYNFGTFDERRNIDLKLPISDGVVATFQVISGILPSGLRLAGNYITGTPFEVARPTEFRFVIRATTNSGEVSDRTFLMSISGDDQPIWITASGDLPVGANQAYYIIDNSFVDFRLSAIDSDTATGQELTYFIPSGGGELPPGLIMSPSGRISGFIQPLLAVSHAVDPGFYDSGLYDSISYDFGDGYDSYVHLSAPRKLNRNYEFTVAVSDQTSILTRTFRIYVVGDDFFRADTTITQAGNGTYTADSTFIHSPIFTTPNYLGVRRANNYQTFVIETYEDDSSLGKVTYSWSPVNAMISGITERQRASDNRVGQQIIRFTKSSGVPQIGHKFNFYNEFLGATNRTYTITGVETVGGNSYAVTIDLPLEVSIPTGHAIYLGTESTLPPGMNFDTITGKIHGIIPFQPAVTTTYNFTIKASRQSGSEIAISRRVFTVDILGEVDGTLNWVSPSNLGTIDVGYPCLLSVKAETTSKNTSIQYSLESGNLPPGLSLSMDGEIVGKVNQMRNQIEYRGFWDEGEVYHIGDVIRRDSVFDIKSVIRRKNIASIVTAQEHNFKTADVVSIVTSDAAFNYYDGVAVSVDSVKINSVLRSIENRVTFSIPAQEQEMLAPTFTSISGISGVIDAYPIPREVTVKFSTGNGTGAKFLIDKGANGTTDYVGLVTISLLDPGTGYKPGDTVIISGAQLGGIDTINDLTFTILNGLEFWYKINGNSNPKFNGKFFASESTLTSITLIYNEPPGAFGSGLISKLINNTYELQTLLTPLNYFKFVSTGTNSVMHAVTGTVTGKTQYYQAIKDHTSDSVFDNTLWKLYNFPESDLTMTTFSDGTTFDGNTTTSDKSFTFTVRAQSVHGIITKEFTITTTVPSNAHYSNISVRPMMKPAQRQMFKNFIDNSEVFAPSLIYRIGDPNFGIQRDLTTLIFAGIETTEASTYINAMEFNHKRKRFNFGEIKKAIAKTPGTNDVVYEVVYIELLDPLESSGKYLPLAIEPRYATTGEVIHPSSISLWRRRLTEIPDVKIERNFLPLWMRSIQESSVTELGYVLAIPLCYCNPGAADEVLLNIKNYIATTGFDFKLLNYTVDRYIIDAVTGYYDDKYLAFNSPHII